MNTLSINVCALKIIHLFTSAVPYGTTLTTWANSKIPLKTISFPVEATKKYSQQLLARPPLKPLILVLAALDVR